MSLGRGPSHDGRQPLSLLEGWTLPLAEPRRQPGEVLHCTGDCVGCFLS
jgi:hypothetical protein